MPAGHELCSPPADMAANGYQDLPCWQLAVELQQAFQAFDASDQRVAILSAAGERAFTSGADVTDPASVTALAVAAGDATIVINNAGLCHRYSMSTTPT